MDGSRFDTAAKALANGTSRRSVLKGIVFGAAAIATGRITSVEAAICTAPGPRAFCNADSECCGDAVCLGGGCTCSGDFKQCGSRCIPKTQICLICGSGPIRNCSGVCIDTRINNANCGACGRSCGTKQSCSNGHCCAQGTIWCDGVCKPLNQCV